MIKAEFYVRVHVVDTNSRFKQPLYAIIIYIYFLYSVNVTNILYIFDWFHFRGDDNSGTMQYHVNITESLPLNAEITQVKKSRQIILVFFYIYSSK
jgi:hypothetical protein